MLSYTNNNCNTAAVVLHEIYGINRHISGFCQYLSQSGLDVFAPNFLHREQPFPYSQENVAYDNFINNIGFERSFLHTRGIVTELKHRYPHIFLIGFSVGATVAWLCSQEANLCTGVIGFYGSRIRDYLEVEPACPVLLLFPSIEPALDITSLTQILGKKENVQVKKIKGHHGFADMSSPYYNERSTLEAYKELNIFIHGKTRHLPAT